MVITPTTDLTPFVGKRVCINNFRYAVIERIDHGRVARDKNLHGGVWGLMYEEPRDGYRGCNTAFFFDYDCTIELA